MSKNSNRTDIALLVIRIAFGATMLLFHGWGKITGGPETWERIGSTMQNFGISFMPTVWGFAAAFSETIGSILLAFGLLTRPAAALLASTMVVAAMRHLSLPAGSDGAGFAGASHALEFLAVYVAFVIAGPGRYSLDRVWRRRSS